jgi:hypothetical protein
LQLPGLQPLLLGSSNSQFPARRSTNPPLPRRVFSAIPVNGKRSLVQGWTWEIKRRKPDHNGTDVFTDHTDLRPTLLSLLGLEDDYDHDGRAIFEIMTREAIPPEIREHLDTAERMAHLLKAINAPVGPLGIRTLKMSTTALASNDTNDATYNKIEDQLLDITKRRNAIASRMLSMLEDSTFDGKEFSEGKAKQLTAAAERLLDDSRAIEETEEGDETAEE